MAAKTTTFDGELLALLLNATPIADLADDDQSTPITEVTVALHTSSPGVGGSQATNEIAYTDYARVAVARSAAGWIVSGASASPAANIDFAEMAGGAGGTVTHFSIGTGVANKMMYFGPVTPNLTVTTGVIPRLTTATAITES
jgi:hypothetical protein